MPSDKIYFAFEGGGGKGAAYLAVAQALEAVTTAIGSNAYDKIAGYSGSSAGAMTAVLLSLEANSELLKGLASFGVFEKMYPSANKDPYFAKEGYWPYWRGFIQAKTTQTQQGQESVFNYSRIYAPKYIQEQYRGYYEKLSLEFVDDFLVKMGFVASVFTPLFVLPVVALMDELNIVQKIVEWKVPLFTSETAREKHLTRGSVSNLLTTGGLFVGEEVLHFAAYLSWLMSNYGLLKNTTFSSLPDFDSKVASLQADYLGSPTSSSYSIHPKGHLIFDQSQTSNSSNKPPLPAYSTYAADALATKDDSIPVGNFVTGTMENREIKKGISFTFRDHFNLTKKELVLTSVNLLNGVTYYFSHHSTPDFPVALAVTLSMNLPIWSPIYVKYTSPYGLKYDGWYFDGGINNNFPFRVFNNNWDTYAANYRTRDKVNRANNFHDFWGFILDEDPEEGKNPEPYLSSFPNALNIAGSIAGMKLEQSTSNNFFSTDKVFALKTTGLSTYEFTPDKNVFPKTNTKNFEAVLKFLKAKGFY
jgi:predicted acylesterase/phospholipase RssA